VTGHAAPDHAAEVPGHAASARSSSPLRIPVGPLSGTLASRAEFALSIQRTAGKAAECRGLAEAGRFLPPRPSLDHVNSNAQSVDATAAAAGSVGRGGYAVWACAVSPG
jgi:hypothetical protein